MFFIFFVISPLLVEAKIAINITVHSNKNDFDIKYTGNDYKIVTDKELNLFNVTTEKLNKGMRIEIGKVPNDIFLKNPTKYGDLFYQFNWEPVKRSLKVNEVKVIDILTEEVILKSHEHINNTTVPIKTIINMYENVENSAQSTWFKGGIPEDDIYYNLTLGFGYGNFTYKNKWRSNKIGSSKMAIGETKKGFITIKPFQTIITKLKATKAILLIEIEYKAKLVGQAVANFAQVYGKYHFWAPSMESIMKAAKMNNNIFSREQIEVRCYLNPRLDVRDKLTEELIDLPKKRPLFRIMRNKHVKRILYTKIKKKPRPGKRIKIN